MNKDRITGSYSRHLARRKFEKSFSVGEVGGVADSSTPHNIKLISLLDQEQLQQAPSREEIWTRRKSLLAGLEEDEGICPCLARIFRPVFSTLIGQGTARLGSHWPIGCHKEPA